MQSSADAEFLVAHFAGRAVRLVVREIHRFDVLHEGGMGGDELGVTIAGKVCRGKVDNLALAELHLGTESFERLVQLAYHGGLVVAGQDPFSVNANRTARSARAWTSPSIL